MISIYSFVSIFFGGDSCFLIKGIRKVNYYTYMAKAGGSKVVSEINLRYRKEPVLFHDISSWGMHAMKEDAKYAIRLFAVGETGKIC